MKRLVLACLLALLLGRDSFAGVACSVPFQLTNGTLADASQVMANYNAILACLANNAASSGANNDITSISGLTTPLTAAQGGTSTFRGGTSAGTNTITISVVPNSFTLAVGYKVVFVAGGSNTAATTLNVGSTGALALLRPTPAGPAAMAGGEIVIGQMIEAVYDGIEYQMISRPALDMVPGIVFDYAGAACPVGSLETTGGNQVVATFPALSGVLGTIWGAPGGGNFTLPDLRGRTTFSRDSGGSGRITVAGGNIDGTLVGSTGGQQNKIVAQANLAAFALSVTDPGHTHGTGTTANVGTNANAVPYINPTNLAGGQLTSSSTTGITVASGGSSTPLPTLSNAAIVLKCVKT